nr:hypothetical protein [Candidatus Sigynarchaeota archaeon]
MDAIESYFSYGGMMIGNKEELLDGFLKKIVFRDQEMMIQIKDLMKKEHFDKFIELDGKPNFFAVRNLADLRVRNSDPLAFQWFTALATILFGDIKFTPKTAALFFKRHIRVIISVVSSMISFLPVVVRFITS